MWWRYKVTVTQFCRTFHVTWNVLENWQIFSQLTNLQFRCRDCNREIISQTAVFIQRENGRLAAIKTYILDIFTTMKGKMYMLLLRWHTDSDRPSQSLTSKVITPSRYWNDCVYNNTDRCCIEIAYPSPRCGGLGLASNMMFLGPPKVHTKKT